MIILGQPVGAINSYNFAQGRFAFKIVDVPKKVKNKEEVRTDYKIVFNNYLGTYPKNVLLIYDVAGGKQDFYVAFIDEPMKGSSKLSQNLSVHDAKYIKLLNDKIAKSGIERTDDTVFEIEEAIDASGQKKTFAGAQLYKLKI